MTCLTKVYYHGRAQCINNTYWAVMYTMWNECETVKFTQEKHRLGVARSDYHMMERSELVIVCQNVQNDYNVGGIIRTCDAMLVGKLYLTSKSWNRGAATGAHKLQPLEYVARAELIAQRYRALGYRIVALEQAAEAVPLTTYTFERRTVLMLGNEGEGVTPSLLAEVDDCVVIPQLGWTESLNVAVSASIAIWEYTKQHMLSELA